MRLVVDTSILIDYLRGGTVGMKVFSQIKRENGKLFIPTIVIFELYSGKSIEDFTVLKTVTEFIRFFEKVELTEEIAIRAGSIYRQIGKSIGPQDYIIAATALDLNATIVTLNKKHFQQIPNLALYPI